MALLYIAECSSVELCCYESAQVQNFDRLIIVDAFSSRDLLVESGTGTARRVSLTRPTFPDNSKTG